MPCGCGSKAKTSTGQAQYVYTDSQGQEVLRGTEVQAKAAQIRAGGTGTVKAG